MAYNRNDKKGENRGARKPDFRQDRKPAEKREERREAKPEIRFENNENNEEIIYGKNAVTELLKSKESVDTVFISDSLNESMASFYMALAKDCGAVVKKVHPLKLKNLCGTDNHQGVAAYASTVEYVSIAEILRKAEEKGEQPFIILCDGIEDPHNLGAIMRSAYLLGAHGIIIPKRGGVSVTSIVHKTSAGASMHLPVAKVANIAQAVRNLKENNIFVYCADMNSQPIYKQNLTGPIALVVGSEGKGVQPLVKSLCDDVVCIPMHNAGTNVDSYNASVAAGIIMYEINRQRDLSGK